MGGLFGFINKNREIKIEQGRLAEEHTRTGIQQQNTDEVKRQHDLENWRALQTHALNNIDTQLNKMSPSSPGFEALYKMRSRMLSAVPNDPNNAKLWDDYGQHHQVHESHTEGLDELMNGSPGKPTGQSIVPAVGQTPGSDAQRMSAPTAPFVPPVSGGNGEPPQKDTYVNPTIGANGQSFGSSMQSSRMVPPADQAPQMKPGIEGNGLPAGSVGQIPSIPPAPQAQPQPQSAAQPAGNPIAGGAPIKTPSMSPQQAQQAGAPPAPPLPPENAMQQFMGAATGQAPSANPAGQPHMAPPQVRAGAQQEGQGGQGVPPVMHAQSDPLSSDPIYQMGLKDIQQHGYTSPDIQAHMQQVGQHITPEIFKQRQMQGGIEHLKQTGTWDQLPPHIQANMEYEAYGGKPVPLASGLMTPYNSGTRVSGDQASDGQIDVYGRPVQKGWDYHVTTDKLTKQQTWQPIGPQTFTGTDASGQVGPYNKRTGESTSGTGGAPVNVAMQPTSSQSTPLPGGGTASVRTRGGSAAATAAVPPVGPQAGAHNVLDYMKNVPVKYQTTANKDYSKLISTRESEQIAAEDMRSFLDLAKKGNTLAAEYSPTQGVIRINTDAGVKRVNMAEIKQYMGAGSAWQQLEGKLGKLISGQPIAPSVLKDIREVHDEMSKNRDRYFKNKIKVLNTQYGSTFPDTLATDEGGGTSGTGSSGSRPSLADIFKK